MQATPKLNIIPGIKKGKLPKNRVKTGKE